MAENVGFVEVNNFCFMCIIKCCQMHAVEKKKPNPRKPAEGIVSVGLILGNIFRFRTYKKFRQSSNFSVTSFEI